VDRILDFVVLHHLKLCAKVDALVFADGIGERSQELRQVVGKAIKCLQYQPLDLEKNVNSHFSDMGNVGDIGMGGTTKQTNRYGCYSFQDPAKT
jgi:acetate kinase